MYAILDIESTGGTPDNEGITEIAIYKFDGHEIVDQFISLVNPEREIQPFVVKLTGINNAMLRTAPKFYEIAKRIIEITDGCIIVAHNAVFDYRILRLEFGRLGFDFEKQSICTVGLSQKLLPEQKSHSLGKLVRSLGIATPDRHRATGDAMATLKLFQILLEKDTEKSIVKEFIKIEVEKDKSKPLVVPKLLKIIENLTTKTGVYFVHNQSNEIIYIGKDKNIKRRVRQLFTNSSSKSKRMQDEVYTISYNETGSYLIAILKNIESINTLNPRYNNTSQENLLEYSLYSEKNETGYLTLKLQKTDKRKKEILTFISLQEAKNSLFKIVQNHNLCQKFSGIDNSKNACLKHKKNECDGACIGKVTPTEYNQRVQAFIDENTIKNKNLIIIDKGRTISEKSAILIENGELKGYAFFNLNHQINDIDIFKNILVPIANNRQTNQIIQTFLRENKKLKIIEF